MGLVLLPALLLGLGCNETRESTHEAEPAVDSPHPFLLFNAGEIPKIRERAKADPLLAECFAALQERAQANPDEKKRGWADQLEARAFVAVLERQPGQIEGAIEALLDAAKNRDPEKFYAKADFHSQAEPLRALALAWDFLASSMNQEQKAAALVGLKNWCVTAYAFTEKQWWREASYNVGAIPVSGYGLLALAIRQDARDEQIETCYREACRRIGQNYFPTTWKPSGICYEGPNYAIVGLKYASLFAHAVRRGGGDDLAADSGAKHAMRYLIYQYLPWDGCAPIGDNTGYGARTFAAEYLLALGESRDAEGLWTWRNYARTKRVDALIAYLWYPLQFAPASPLKTGLPTSRYFEVTRDRAGYLFSRSKWEDRNAAFFTFVTRFERCNHQHYDMNSFLFGGFGTLFATHQLLYPYSSEKHGVDHEHNLVTINGGGWPGANRKITSCGDDNSTDGLMVGMALSNFGDYVRGDAKWSYRDNSIMTSDPAIRAERSCLFVKSGPAPYLLILDDHEQTNTPVKYEWQWYAPKLPMQGNGTLELPLLMTAEGGSCALQFIHPAKPELEAQPAQMESSKKEKEKELEDSGLVRIRVTQTGVRVRFASLASLQREEAGRPKATPLPVECRHAAAAGIVLDLPEGIRDTLAWQPEEERVQIGSPLRAGDLQTDGLLALVRVKGGKVAGFVLGEGTYLRWGETWLVKANSSVSVSVGAGDRQINGRMRTRQGLPPELPGHAQVVRLEP